MRKARMFAALATTAALALTTFGVATANAREEGLEETEVTLKNGEIAANEATKVTIYKYDGTDETVKNDGLAKTIDTTKHHLVRNVTFNLIPVQVDGSNSDIDLSTTAGWEAIQKLELTKDNASKLVEGKLEGFKLNDVAKSSQKTGDNGQAEFTNPAKKLYLVTETIAQGDTPEVKLNSTDDGYNAENPWKAVTINKKTAPFFLTVPLSTSDTTTGKDGWLYDIKIYPKNEVTKDTIQKHLESVSSDVMDKGAVDVTWSVSLPLGQPSSGDAYKKVELVDNLNAALTYKSVSDFKISGGNNGGSPNGTDSVLDEDEGDFTVTKDGQKITIALTAAGLAKANQHVTGTLTGKIVTTQTKVQTVPNDISGTIDNNPTVSTDGVDNGGGASNWATVKVQKVKTGDHNTFLPGAEFKFVEYTLKESKTLTDGGDYTQTQVEEAATIQDIAGATYTSGAKDGTFTAKLFVGKDAVKSRNVCLVETKAPKGYDVPENNYKCFTLNADTTENLKEDEDPDYTIENSQSSKLTQVLENLPKTGAAGLVLMTLAGALLIGAGFFAVAANRRREQE